MTELKNVTAVENTVNRILKDNEKTMAKLSRDIEKEEAKIVSASSAKESAKNNGDIPGYRKADRDLSEAMDAKAVSEEFYAKLNDSPIISKEEYERMCNDVIAEIRGLEEQTKKELVDYSDQMKAKAMQLQDATIKANAVLHRLQHDLYKDNDRMRNSMGEILYLPFEDKRVDTQSTIEWGKCGVKHYQYQQYTGRKEEEERPIYF